MQYFDQKQNITNVYINFRNVDGSYRCESCDWPLCGSKRCEKESIHKTSGECDILSKCSYKVIIFIWIPCSIYYYTERLLKSLFFTYWILHYSPKWSTRRRQLLSKKAFIIRLVEMTNQKVRFCIYLSCYNYCHETNKGYFKLIYTMSYVTSQYYQITPSTNVCLHSDASW